LFLISIGLFLRSITEYALLGATTEFEDKSIEACAIARALLAFPYDSHCFAGVCHDRP
jgi:hypothetical protein